MSPQDIITIITIITIDCIAIKRGSRVRLPPLIRNNSGRGSLPCPFVFHFQESDSMCSETQTVQVL